VAFAFASAAHETAHQKRREVRTVCGQRHFPFKSATVICARQKVARETRLKRPLSPSWVDPRAASAFDWHSQVMEALAGEELVGRCSAAVFPFECPMSFSEGKTV
jgi:hypothetical protein